MKKFDSILMDTPVKITEQASRNESNIRSEEMTGGFNIKNDEL
jgi:hypothetical protein